MPTRYRLLTAPRSASHAATAAIAILDLRGDLHPLASALGITHLPDPGDLRLCNIPNIDEALLCRIGLDHAQLHTHAGPVVLARLTRMLEAAGFQHAPAIPRSQDELLEHWLAWAPSPLAVDLLLAQPRLRRLTPGPPVADPRLDRLLIPPLVAAVGPPNVGKSSLLNALARRSVSIVSDLPGTTRDPVGALLDFRGIVVRWIDLPGIRSTDDPIETQAIRRAHDWATRADLIIHCTDHSAPLNSYPPDLHSTAPCLTVRTKSDLAPCSTSPTDVACSARTGDGLSDLSEAIAERLVPAAIRQPDALWHLPST